MVGSAPGGAVEGRIVLVLEAEEEERERSGERMMVARGVRDVGVRVWRVPVGVCGSSSSDVV